MIMLRRASLAAFVLLLIQYALGMYVNLYVTVPAADHGQSVGKVISEGPGALSVHAVIGLLLVLDAIWLVVLASRTRRWGVVTADAVGLVAILGAAFAGASFASQSSNGASMGMALLAGVAILSYGVSLYLLPRKG
ncbi:MAG TPA: hypothetical protein VKV06_05815 [Acidimicrobiales bacterium]|nr:hypothetical protein [Acidimicrobiales bacterium]